MHILHSAKARWHLMVKFLVLLQWFASFDLSCLIFDLEARLDNLADFQLDLFFFVADGRASRLEIFHVESAKRAVTTIISGLTCTR